MRRQLEHGDLELYMPYVARDMVVHGARDTVASIKMMADWYRAGSPH